ncbi:hypothetical protein [Thermococcus sp. Bubb.Bath]|uniref:hypothetical protein n=1 Tax=Thermococcus sp. Bubb.Bath TaxID=1638242 RepID=UPI001439BFB6|nr:hypothetical protein [Thermococcus sp. Bubb.Bath]NJF24501.1 hypothetical protein [Thermococcus sp. Bubb.Bath]
MMIVAVVAAASTASGCVGGSGSSEKNWLELVPANAVAAAVFDVSTVKEKAVQDVLKNLTLYREYLQFRQEVLNETGIDIETLHRAIFVVNDVDSNEYTIPDIALYVEGKVDTEKFESKIKESKVNLTKTTYDGVTLYYYPEDNSAVAFTSDYIILGSKSVVEQVIDLKNGKGNWAKQYSDVVGKAGGGNLVAVADARYFAGKMGLNKPGEGRTEVLIRPIENHMKYVALRLNVGSEEYRIRVVIEADDEDGARMIAKNVKAGLTLLNTTLTFRAQVAGNSSQFKAALELLNSISVKQDGSFVSMGLDVMEKQLEEVASMELAGNEFGMSKYPGGSLDNSTTEIQITTTSPNFGG